MGKVKPHRTPPSLDMTPMVDLAFLLVTFFMLTAKITQQEPVSVATPSATTTLTLPETDILTLLVSKDGRVFYNMDNQIKRAQLIKEIGGKYGITFTPEQVQKFAVMEGFGLPVQNLPEYLDTEPDARKEINQPGIPVDSLNNQLADWLVYSRMVNPKLRVAIKGDGDANYPVIRKIVNTLQDNRISRFNLITNLETGGAAAPAAAQ